MASSYIAVLNVYAVRPFFISFCVTSERNQFASVHDVSWRTKGDNKVNTDLGVVSAGKGGNKNENEVDVAIPTAEADTTAAYSRSVIEGTENGVESRSCDGARRLLRDF